MGPGHWRGSDKGSLLFIKNTYLNTHPLDPWASPRLPRWVVGFVSQLLTLALLVLSSRALATYAIVGIDLDNRQVGGAITSCVGEISLFDSFGIVPARGVVVGIGAFDDQSLKTISKAQRDLQRGYTSEDISKNLVELSGDEEKQFALIDISEDSFFFDGEDLDGYYSSVLLRHQNFVFGILGNTLTSHNVLEQAKEAFISTEGSLTNRLLAALIAGGNSGEGDERCTVLGHPSDSAYIEVVDAEGNEVFKENIVSQPRVLEILKGL